MITPPTAPAPGKPISASFFSRLISWVKSGQLIEGVGYRLRRTPNGTALDLKVGVASSSGSLPGLWTVVPPKDGEDGYFDYPYYMVGTRLYRATDEETKISGLQDGIACIILDISGSNPSATIRWFDTFSEVQSYAESAIDLCVKPLYEFKNGGAIRDFRNMPTFGTWEFEQ